MTLKKRWLLLAPAVLLLYLLFPTKEEIANRREPGTPPAMLPRGTGSPLPPPASPGETAAWVTLNEKGVAYFKKGEYAAALEAFANASALRPEEETLRRNLAEAHAQLGWEALRENRPAAAEPHFQTSIQMFEGGAAFYFGAAAALHGQQRETEALQRVAQGLSRDPNQPIGHKLQGEIYEAQHDPARAIEAWKRALALDPKDLSLAARLEKLAREESLFSRFQRAETRHFELLFEGREEKERARTILSLLEEAYREIGKAFSYYPAQTVVALLYTNQQFRDVTRSPAWTKALFDGKIHLPIGGPIENEALLKKIIYHEFTHALIHQLSHGKTPTWLNEGLALYFEEGAGDEKVDRSRPTPPLPLDRLHGSFLSYDEPTARRAYETSRSATAYLIDRYGFFRIKLFLEELGGGDPFSERFEQQFLISYPDFQRAWQRN
ncbi:MAG: tetratricopeptide repeat protein [Nitrospirae bacterium]|nr:tetratricopeptide repeat protein [Candidatus Manganitrophaceae bacterium]